MFNKRLYKTVESHDSIKVVKAHAFSFDYETPMFHLKMIKVT